MKRVIIETRVLAWVEETWILDVPDNMAVTEENAVDVIGDDTTYPGTVLVSVTHGEVSGEEERTAVAVRLGDEPGEPGEPGTAGASDGHAGGAA